MRAVVVAEHGGPEVLQVQERQALAPSAGQVQVAVRAAGVNFIDIYQRSGAYSMELPYVAGSEGAGEVIAVGDDVESVHVGDAVAWAMQPGSGYTEVATLDAERVVPIPSGVTYEQAAAVMLQGMTAHYLVNSTFPARAGHVALVHAAAGGVGLLLCQMLASKGVRVIGTTSTQEKAQSAKAAGAHDIIFYREQDLVAEVKNLTGGKGVDVVYDGVGQATFNAGLESLKPRGMMALFGAASGPVEPIDPQILNAQGSLFLTRPSLGHYVADTAELRSRADDVLGQVAAGTLAVSIGGRYPLEDASRAHEDLASGHTSGKLLLV